MNTLEKKTNNKQLVLWPAGYSTLHFGVLIREALENIPDISRGGGFTNWTKCISDRQVRVLVHRRGAMGCV